MMSSASLMVILAKKKARKCIYRGGESLSKEAVEDLGREVDTGGDSFSASSQEESEDDSEVEQLDAPPRGKFRIYSIYQLSIRYKE